MKEICYVNGGHNWLFHARQVNFGVLNEEYINGQES